MMDDTAPEMKKRYYELLRARTPEQRLRSAVALSGAVRKLAEAGIRCGHPDASDAEVRRFLVARLYGEDFLRRLRRL